MLEKFKDWLHERTKENAVESEISYQDRNGNTITEKVFLKRSKIPVLGDWGRIYPTVELSERGKKILWTNLIFGGYRNFIKLIIILTIVGLAMLGYYEIFTQYETLRNMPCVQSCLI